MLDPFHYFFFSLCSENVLHDNIERAESYGCEFLQIIAGMMPVNSRIAQGNGQPQMMQVFRIFVRCRKSAWPGIQSKMETDAEAERKKGIIST